MTTTSEAVPLSNADQIVSQIEELQKMLQVASPGYESLLFTIHHNLSKDEELVHLLSEEQVGVICAGLAKKKNVVIAEVEKKGSKTAGGKKLKDVSLSDL